MICKREYKSLWTLLSFELHVNILDQAGEKEKMKYYLEGECLREISENNHQEQQLLVAAPDGGGFCLKMFLFNPAEPSAKRLGVSKIYTSTPVILLLE